MITLTEGMKALLSRFKADNGQPQYRLIWSEDRLEWHYGEMKPKYGVGRNRWMLEKWCSPEMYGSPEEWEACKEGEISILGPFPRQGDWEHSYTFECDGFPIEPTIDLVELLCRAIEAGKMHTRSERWQAIKDAKEKVERDRHELFDQLWHDAAPAPGAKLPDHIERMDSFNVKTTADVPQEFKNGTLGFRQMTSEEK